jgi:hypothetical protein
MLLKYFINLFDKKLDLNLYSILLETIVLVGQYNEEMFFKILPDIYSYLVKLIFNNKKSFAIIFKQYQ